MVYVVGETGSFDLAGAGEFVEEPFAKMSEKSHELNKLVNI